MSPLTNALVQRGFDAEDELGLGPVDVRVRVETSPRLDVTFCVGFNVPGWEASGDLDEGRRTIELPDGPNEHAAIDNVARWAEIVIHLARIQARR